MAERVRGWVRLAWLAVLLVGCATAPPVTPGASASSPSTLPTSSIVTSAGPPTEAATATATAPASAAASATLAADLPAPGTKVAPGLYTKKGFVPQLSFQVGTGWTAAQAYPGFFDIEDDPGSVDVIAVQFGNVTGAANATAVVAAIAANARLSATGPVDVSIGGQHGMQVVVDTTDPADSSPAIFRPVLTVTPGPLSIASGRRLQVTLIDVDNGVLAVLVGGSIRNWAATLALAAPVVASLTIGG